jgi:hypothetical protein
MPLLAERHGRHREVDDCAYGRALLLLGSVKSDEERGGMPALKRRMRRGLSKLC